MKNTSLILSLLLCACVTETLIKQEPSEFLRAENCINSDRVAIFQYDKETTLMEVYICQDKLLKPGEECKNFGKYNGYKYEYDKQLVAVNTTQFIGGDKELTGHMFDGSVIGLGNGCLIPDGTYSYVTPMGVQKTVQKVKFIGGDKAKTSNPEYKSWKIEQDTK